MGNHEIKQINKHLFKITNKENGQAYDVDTATPNCSCKAFQYTRRNKAGMKRLCKHIKMCRGITYTR